MFILLAVDTLGSNSKLLHHSVTPIIADSVVSSHQDESFSLLRPCQHASASNMTVSDTPPSPLSRSAIIPIAQLSPSIDAPSHRHIEGIVSLLWPYSSSTQTFTLLVSEPDFRLRRSRGQVRVGFHGASAKAVANARVGIGDTVLLSLRGAQWERPADDEHPVTPGKGVEWNLRYDSGVVLEVCHLRGSCVLF